MFQLNMADIAFELALHDRRYVPMVHRFGQDFVIVANVLQRTGAGGIGLWNEDDHFYFDVIRHGATGLPLQDLLDGRPGAAVRRESSQEPLPRRACRC